MRINDIYFIHGEDYTDMTLRLLERADLKSLIGDTAKAVALKPNLVSSTPPEDGATTHGEVLEGAILYLKANGFRNITVMESSWAGARTKDVFQICHYDRICRRQDVPFLDLKQDSYQSYDACGMQIAVCDAAMHTDFMINLPVLKGHCQTRVTCALKNNKGVIPDFEKRRFHTLGLHKPIAHLNTVCRNDFILVDNICGDPEFEDGGSPLGMNRLLAFRDPVLCDAFACESLGFQPDEVPYVRLAEKLHVGSADLESASRIYVNRPEEEPGVPVREGRIASLAKKTSAKDACSACYGALMRALLRMERRGTLSSLREEICIGQGYREQEGSLGVGACTARFARTLPGCPPEAAKMVRFLEQEAAG